MFRKGAKVVAKDDHFDDYYGDIWIDRGDRFEVVDSEGIDNLVLKPEDPRKYPGESTVRSHSDFFKEHVA